MTDKCVGLLGATSLIGECLLVSLARSGWRVLAFTRRPVEPSGTEAEWHRLMPIDQQSTGDAKEISCWVSLAPIWVLPNYYALLEASKARTIVALSSTSRFSKADSSDIDEKAVALRLVEAEADVLAWAESKGVKCVILRPTLVYGLGRDKNVSEIARFIRRFGFFPLFGRAEGLRQPVHARDVVAACLAALENDTVSRRDYNLSGGEVLSYREMVGRVFVALGYRTRFLKVPLNVFRMTLTLLRLVPRYRNWSVAMAERMNRDLVFDHADATRDLGFHPRPFFPGPEDLPI